MTVITLTTAGHEDLEMSDSGRIFTILLLIGGIGVFTYMRHYRYCIFNRGTITKFFPTTKNGPNCR